MLMAASEAGCWYVVYARSNFENRVAEDLRGKGIGRFVPCYEEVPQSKDRRKQVKVPLFSGYVFTWFQDCPEKRSTVRRPIRTSGQASSKSPLNTFEYLIIDSPRVASVADYNLLETSDSVELVVRPGHAGRTLTGKANETVGKRSY
jgi:transcription antitermination factor NusG